MTRRTSHSPLTGCRHCKSAVARGGSTVVLHRVSARTGSSNLLRCRHCGVYWQQTGTELRVLQEAEAVRAFPESFRDGQVRGPGLTALQEGLADLRKQQAHARPAPAGSTKEPGIRIENGDVVAAEGTISSATNRTQFMLSELFDSGAWSNESDGWYVAGAIPLTLSGAPFGASALFHDEVLDSITLSIDDPQYGESWDDYTVEREMARDARHKEWLSVNVGDWARPFTWGRILCGFNSRDGFSKIVVQYR